MGEIVTLPRTLLYLNQDNGAGVYWDRREGLLIRGSAGRWGRPPPPLTYYLLTSSLNPLPYFTLHPPPPSPPHVRAQPVSSAYEG